MAENAEILQITTKDFFDKYFDVLMSIAGRTNTELLPENISSFEMLDNRYLLKIKKAIRESRQGLTKGFLMASCPLFRFPLLAFSYVHALRIAMSASIR